MSVTRPYAVLGYALALALFTWPVARLTPVGGIDGSWQAGIVMAAEQGLQWGTDIIFTYGPLGFLAVPQLYSPLLGALAWIFVGAVHTALCIVVVQRSLRTERWWIGVPLAAVGALLAAPIAATTGVVVIALLHALDLLRRRHDTPSTATMPGLYLVAIGSPLLLLTKFNDGVAMFGILVALGFGLRPGKRQVAAVAAVTAASLVGAWALVGQSAGDLPAFLHLSLEVASGYSTAMGVDDSTRGFQYLTAAMWSLAVAAALAVQTSTWPLRTRVAAALAVGIVVFLAYKHAFVRHGGGGLFEILILIAIWSLPWRSSLRYYRLLLLGALLTASMGTIQATPIRYFDGDGPARALSQTISIVSTSERTEIISDARAALRSAYQIPPTIVRAIGPRPIHIEPFETGVAWAYPELHWRPLPVIQTYSAYTEALDRANAEALRSPHGPQVILAHWPATIDGRAPFLEAPLSVLEMVCRFAETAAADGWQVLERRSDRCGEERFLNRVSFGPGERVAIPEVGADQLLVARIEGIETGVLARTRALLHKSPTWQIWRDEVGKGRLVPQRTDGPMLLSVPHGLSWSEAFTPPSAPGSFSVVTGPRAGLAHPVQPELALTVTFYVVPFTP